MIDETEYMTAKIYSLSGQPKFRGTGAKREYNTFFDYARIELLHFLDQVANLRSKKKAVVIARTFLIPWYERRGYKIYDDNPEYSKGQTVAMNKYFEDKE